MGDVLHGRVRLPVGAGVWVVEAVSLSETGMDGVVKAIWIMLGGAAARICSMAGLAVRLLRLLPVIRGAA